MATQQASLTTNIQKARARCIKKFLHYFRHGFDDPTYIDWERGYKENAHFEFHKILNQGAYKRLLQDGKYRDITTHAVRIESRTNLLFSFEKMALRDAVKSGAGAKAFASGLYEYLYGKDPLQIRFENFVNVVGSLPRKQTRVLTWPLVTVFGFIGNPKEHIFLKPRVTQVAALKYEFDFNYTSKPNWGTYSSLFQFAKQVKEDTKTLKPKDYIDLQSFIWVLGSDEYPD